MSDRAARLTPPPTEPRPSSGLGAVPDPALPGTAAPLAPNASAGAAPGPVTAFPVTAFLVPPAVARRHRPPGPTAALAARASMATRRRHTGAAAARLTRVGLGLLQQWGAILSLLGLHLAAATRTAQRAQGQTARRHRCSRERGVVRPGPARSRSALPGPARLGSTELGFSFLRRRGRSALRRRGRAAAAAAPGDHVTGRGGRKRLQRRAGAGPPSAAIFSEGSRPLAPCLSFSLSFSLPLAEESATKAGTDGQWVSLCAMSRLLTEKLLIVRTNLIRLIHRRRLLLSEGERPLGAGTLRQPQWRAEKGRLQVQALGLSVTTEMTFNNKLHYLQQMIFLLSMCVQCATPGVRF